MPIETEHCDTFKNPKQTPENQLQMERSQLLMLPDNVRLFSLGKLLGGLQGYHNSINRRGQSNSIEPIRNFTRTQGKPLRSELILSQPHVTSEELL